MAARMLKLLLVALASPLLCSGRRAESPTGTIARSFEAKRGVPKLEVLRTGSCEEAAAFIEQWSTAREFGLFVQLAADSSFLFRQRVAILGISRGSQVLIYDLRPSFRQPPQPLLPAIADFLQSEKRTFFGMGLLRPMAHLAEEFDINMRSIDLKLASWPQVSLDGGLYRAADRLLGVQFLQRPSLSTLYGQAVYTYLQWAVANYCRSSFGKQREEWILTASQLAGVNVTKVRAITKVTDAEGEQRQAEAQAEQLLRWRAAALRQKGGRGAWKDKRDRFATAREVRGRMRQLARALRQQTGQ